MRNARRLTNFSMGWLCAREKNGLLRRLLCRIWICFKGQEASNRSSTCFTLDHSRFSLVVHLRTTGSVVKMQIQRVRAVEIETFQENGYMDYEKAFRIPQKRVIPTSPGSVFGCLDMFITIFYRK